MNREETILKNIVGPAILHIGCAGHQVAPESPYWLHEQLHKHFPDLYGIDISQENLNRMGQLGYRNIFRQSAESFQFDFKFDTIIAGELIEHLSNPGLLLNQSRLNLKPGGRLIITTPNPFSLLNNWYALLKFPRTCQNPEHTTWFCIETLRTSQLGTSSRCLNIIWLKIIKWTTLLGNIVCLHEVYYFSRLFSQRYGVRTHLCLF